MKVPENFEPKNQSFAEDDHKEYLQWISLDSTVKYYPEFFKTELKHPQAAVKHFVTDGRNIKDI